MTPDGLNPPLRIMIHLTVKFLSMHSENLEFSLDDDENSLFIQQYESGKLSYQLKNSV